MGYQMADLLLGNSSIILTVLWAIILFNVGTLLQKNRDVARYYGIRERDETEHLIDRDNIGEIDPSRVIASIGTTLKIYAVVYLLLRGVSFFFGFIPGLF